jgi:hypothetical protein
MASDQSPTANKTIITVALLSVFILISLKFILTSYYVEMTEANARALSSTPDQLRALQAAQRKDLAQSSTPIDVAMKNLAASGRENTPPVIAPVQAKFDETGPLVGWNGLKREVANFVVPFDASAPLDADGGEGGAPLSSDGGALLTADGGVASGGDAGRPSATHVVDGGPAIHATSGDAGH